MPAAGHPLPRDRVKPFSLQPRPPGASVCRASRSARAGVTLSRSAARGGVGELPGPRTLRASRPPARLRPRCCSAGRRRGEQPSGARGGSHGARGRRQHDSLRGGPATLREVGVRALRRRGWGRVGVTPEVTGGFWRSQGSGVRSRRVKRTHSLTTGCDGCTHLGAAPGVCLVRTGIPSVEPADA